MATWHRQPNESNKSYAAFQTYLSLGAERSLEKVRQKIGKSKAICERWSSRWEWVARATAYDQHMAEVAQAQREAEVQRVVQNHYANMHTRVQELDEVATMLREMIDDEDNLWNESKYGRTFNSFLIAEFRGCLDDIAAELGHRVKKSDVTLTGLPVKVMDRDDLDAV